MGNIARIIINYRKFEPTKKYRFELEIKDAWNPVRQYADTPEIAFWKSIGIRDGLWASGFNAKWIVNSIEFTVHPSVSDFESIMVNHNE